MNGLPHPSIPPVSSILGLLTVCIVLALHGPARAQTIPLPPPRPRDLEPKPAPPPPPAEAAPDNETKPEDHPQETGGGLTRQEYRARMHACGLEWNDMKEDGRIGDLTWRDFSRTCLERR
jgi:hypothetical protein